MPRATSSRLLLVGLLATALVLAACSGSGDDAAEPPSSADVAPTSTTASPGGTQSSVVPGTTAAPTTTPTTAAPATTAATTTTAAAPVLDKLPPPEGCDGLVTILAGGVGGLAATEQTGAFELLGIDVAAGSFDLNLHDPDAGPWRMLRVRGGALVTTLSGPTILDEAEVYLGEAVAAGRLDPTASSVSDCFTYVYGSS